MFLNHRLSIALRPPVRASERSSKAKQNARIPSCGCSSMGTLLPHEPRATHISIKPLWRPFCMEFEGVIEDFNQGTLLRLDANKGYDEANTCVVPRIQFLAIEIARNRQGLNDRVKKTAVGS
nr:unnamed protein product [Spirometra erinaceieuropaei]